MMDENKDTIIRNILLYLDGWILHDDLEELDDNDYNKTVNNDEVLQYFNVALSSAASYLGLNNTSEIDSNLLIFAYMWSAGLIYKKYDVRPNDLIDETYPVGYGDQLIINAKVGLKPYRKYNLTAW